MGLRTDRYNFINIYITMNGVIVSVGTIFKLGLTNSKTYMYIIYMYCIHENVVRKLPRQIREHSPLVGREDT